MLLQGVKDDRNLWPEMLRVIKEFRPAWVVAENVANLITVVEPEYSVSLEGTATKINQKDQEIWTEESKYIIESICEDFERAEYQVETVIIPALSVGARHRRDRLWFIAHTDSHNQTPLSRRILSSIEKETALSEEKQGRDKSPVLNNRLSDLSGDLKKSLKSRGDFRHLLRTTEPPICGANDGISYRMDGLKLSASQYNESQLKSLGNAIVPHVAFEIYQAIGKANKKYNLHI